MFVGFFFHIHIRNRLEQRGGARRSSAEEEPPRAARVCVSVCVSLLCMSLLCVSAAACLSATGFACVCVSASACLRLRGCLGRVRRCACRVSCPASAANSWPCARRSRGACAVWAMSHTRASRNFGFEVRGERQARVPHFVCVRVWSHAVQRVLCVFCVFCVFCVSP